MEVSDQENYSRVESFLWQLLDRGKHGRLHIGLLLDRMNLMNVRLLYCDGLSYVIVNEVSKKVFLFKGIHSMYLFNYQT